MSDQLLDSLNPTQKAACEQFQGPAMVVAGAGSGKTRVITYRIAHMIQSGVKPYSIMSLTFTNKAAKEMRQRIEAVVGAEAAQQIWMGTFHSIFSRILRIEAQHLGFDRNFTIYDSNDSIRVVKDIIKTMNLDDKAYTPKRILGRISAAKNNLITSESYAANSQLQSEDAQMKIPKCFQIYRAYMAKCKSSSAMDFDDLLLYTNVLFRDHPELLHKYQERYQYLLVDEYQDTNISQYLLIKKLVEQHKNICVVGDDAQSIYSFRGAKIENILNFQKDYPNLKSFKLEQNYRSSQNIVDAANSLIKHNERQLQKDVFSENSVGTKLRIINSQTDSFEGHEVIAALKALVNERGYRYEDCAILYRTNSQSRIFEQVLLKHNVPYKVYSGLSFYQRAEIKSFLAYLRLAVNPQDEDALTRIINYPKRGIGDTTLGKIRSYGIQTGKPLIHVLLELDPKQVGINAGTATKLKKFGQLLYEIMEAAKNYNAFEAATQILARSGMEHHLADDTILENENRRKNVGELLNSIQEFIELSSPEDEPTLQEFLQNVALLTDAEAAGGEDHNRVKLMTIHASKGLEFKNVYVVGLEENLFPSQTATQNNEVEEERRLMYVAMTRAEENLTLSYANSRMKFGETSNAEPSRFLNEIGEHFIQQDTRIKPTYNSLAHYSTTYASPSASQPTANNFTPKPKLTYNTANQHMRENLSKKLKKLEPGVAAGAANYNARIDEGSKVKHALFGVGKVEAISGEEANKRVTVLFNNGNRKTLLLKFAQLDFLG